MSEDEIMATVNLARAHVAGGDSPPMHPSTTGWFARALVALHDARRGAIVDAFLAGTGCAESGDIANYRSLDDAAVHYVTNLEK